MSEHSGEKDAALTEWEQRKLAIIHDTALALSEGEWDALRWHFAEVWDDAYDCCASDGTPQFHNGNPYRDDEATVLSPSDPHTPDAARPTESVEDVLAAHVLVHRWRAGGSPLPPFPCTCGEWAAAIVADGRDENGVTMEDQHRTHVAAALAEAGIGSLAQARAEALNEAADAWHSGQWTVLTPKIKAATQPQWIIGAAQAVTDWLRARAAAQQAAARGQGEGVGR